MSSNTFCNINSTYRCILAYISQSVLFSALCEYDTTLAEIVNIKIERLCYYFIRGYCPYIFHENTKYLSLHYGYLILIFP